MSVANGSTSLIEKEPLSDSDWEYEYDESQTEDFYFTLDLPGSVDRPSKRRKTNAQQGTPQQTLEAAPESDRTQYITNGNTAQRPHDQQQQSEPIQFHGLHTTTPSVDYGDQRYECRWTTDLGTQFHVSRPGLVKKPYRAGHAVDVVALSRVRLTGCHVTALPSPKAAGVNGNSEGQALVLDDDEDEEDGPENGSTLKADDGDSPPSFLERVAEIQRRKERQTAHGVNDTQAAKSPLASAVTQSRLVTLTSSPQAQNGYALAPDQNHEAQAGELAVASNHHEREQPNSTDCIPLGIGRDGVGGTDSESV